MVPAANPGAWVVFTVVFLAILAALTLVLNAKLGRELNDKLAELGYAELNSFLRAFAS